jgi:hypothetical protein
MGLLQLPVKNRGADIAILLIFIQNRKFRHITCKLNKGFDRIFHLLSHAEEEKLTVCYNKSSSMNLREAKKNLWVMEVL